MVVDNADSDDIMFGSPSGEVRTSSNRSLSDYLPSSTNGSIVITSRSRKVAEGLIEYADDILEIGPMVEKDATALLSKKLKQPQQDVDLIHLTPLVRELDFMPLAITQAAAYINQLGPRMTVSIYLDRLAQSDFDREMLLQNDIRDPRRDGRASNSIISTWHTSFEHIRQARVSAARLLALMSLFDREGIPEALLKGRYFQDEEQSNWSGKLYDARHEYDFNEDIAMLKMYSLIRSGVSDLLFDMHRLVQFSTRKWLDLHGQLAYWQDRYIDILDAEFPPPDYPNWPLCKALFPHVEVLMSCQTANENHLLKRAKILWRGALWAHVQGQDGIAHQMVQISLQDRERLLGPDHFLAFESMSLLAVVLQRKGKPELAEDMQRRALIGTEKQLGTRNRYTLDCALNLASVLREQSKYKEAEELCRRVSAQCEVESGPDNSRTRQSMQELALNLLYQGKLDEAEQISRKGLAWNEKQLGLSHPNTCVSMVHLAIILAAKQSREEAEQLIRRSLEGCEKQLGPCHPTTLSAVHNLAMLSERRGDYPAALRLYDRAIEGRVQVLGASHPYTLTSQENRHRLLQQMKIQTE